MILCGFPREHYKLRNPNSTQISNYLNFDVIDHIYEFRILIGIVLFHQNASEKIIFG